MAVLTDPDESHVHRVLAKPPARLAADDVRIALAVEEVIGGDPGRLDEPLEQESTEARRMLEGQTDVLVEMEHLHLVPLDAWLADQPLEERDLRRAGGRDDPRASAPRDRHPDPGGSVRRGRCRRLPGIAEHTNHERSLASAPAGCQRASSQRARNRLGRLEAGVEQP